MKLRLDYVTNSSTSSFILAMNKELTQEQKDIIVDYVKKELLGEVILSGDDPASAEEFIEKVNSYDGGYETYIRESKEESVVKAHEEGKDLRLGILYREVEELERLKDIHKNLWDALAKAGALEIVDWDVLY